MNFAQPKSLDFSVERPCSEFLANPLGTNEPIRYTHYIAGVTTEINTRGIKMYLPGHWSIAPLASLVFVPPGHPAHAAYVAAVAARAALVNKFDYFTTTPNARRLEI